MEGAQQSSSIPISKEEEEDKGQRKNLLLEASPLSFEFIQRLFHAYQVIRTKIYDYSVEVGETRAGQSQLQAKLMQ